MLNEDHTELSKPSLQEKAADILTEYRHNSAHVEETPRTAAARKAWATRRQRAVDGSTKLDEIIEFVDSTKADEFSELVDYANEIVEIWPKTKTEVVALLVGLLLGGLTGSGHPFLGGARGALALAQSRAIRRKEVGGLGRTRVLKHRALGNRIRAARHARDEGQLDLANHLGVSRAAISQWESGKTRPSSPKLDAFVRHYDLKYEWLLHGRGPQHQHNERNEHD